MPIVAEPPPSDGDARTQRASEADGEAKSSQPGDLSLHQY